MRDAAGELDHFDPALHRADRGGKRLAVLVGHDCSKCFLILFQKTQEFLHDPSSPQRRRVAPGRVRGARRLHRSVDDRCVGEHDALGDLSGRRVVHLAIALRRGNRLAIDPHRDGAELQFGGLVHAAVLSWVLCLILSPQASNAARVAAFSSSVSSRSGGRPAPPPRPGGPCNFFWWAAALPWGRVLFNACLPGSRLARIFRAWPTFPWKARCVYSSMRRSSALWRRYGGVEQRYPRQPSSTMLSSHSSSFEVLTIRRSPAMRESRA